VLVVLRLVESFPELDHRLSFFFPETVKVDFLSGDVRGHFRNLVGSVEFQVEAPANFESKLVLNGLVSVRRDKRRADSALLEIAFPI